MQAQEKCANPQKGKWLQTYYSKGEIILLENLRFHLEEEKLVKLDDGNQKGGQGSDAKSKNSAEFFLVMAIFT